MVDSNLLIFDLIKEIKYIVLKNGKKNLYSDCNNNIIKQNNKEDNEFIN